MSNRMDDVSGHITVEEFLRSHGEKPNATATVKKWLRLGNIRGKKIKGKWYVCESEKGAK